MHKILLEEEVPKEEEEGRILEVGGEGRYFHAEMFDLHFIRCNRD